MVKTEEILRFEENPEKSGKDYFTIESIKKYG